MIYSKKTKIISLFLVIASVLAVLFFRPVYEKADATAVKYHGYDDDFNDPNFSNVWVNRDSAIEVSYNALRFNGANYWGGGLVATNKAFGEQRKAFKISVDLLVAEKLGAPYVGLAIGGQNTSTEWFAYEYATLFQISTDGRISLFEKTAEGEIKENVETRKDCKLFSSDDGVVRVEYSFTPAESETYDLKVNAYYLKNYDYASKTGDLTEIPTDYTESEFLFRGLTVTQPYVAFNTNNLVVDFLKCSMTGENGETIFSDDFTESKITYSSEAVGDSLWHVSAYYDKSQIYVAPIGKAVFNNDDYIVFNSRLSTVDERLNDKYIVSGKFFISSVGKGSAFGFGLSMEQTSSRADADFIGIANLDGNEYTFARIKNGKIEKRSAEVFSLQENVGYAVTLSIRSGRSVEISLGDYSATFRDVDANGFMCVGASNAGESTKVYFDDFSYDYFVSKTSDEKNAENDFLGIKEDENGFYDYYLSEKDWYVGSKISFPSYVEGVKRGSLVFDGCDQYSCFGPKRKYADFLVQFRVRITSTASNDASFGISFAKSSFSSNVDLSNAVGFFCNGYEKVHKTDEDKSFQTTIIGRNVTTSNGGNACYIRENGEAVNMWDGRTYVCAFEVRGRNVYVYFKEENQPDDVLAICRGVFTDVNTYGYVSVYGSNGVGFSLVDFKLTNLNAE